MELPNEEGEEMPLPLNSTYGGGHGHMIHHHDHHSPPPPPPPSSHHHHLIIPSSAPPPQNGPPISSSAADDHAAVPFKKIIIRYRECLKNHAAAMGGNATDGCGEFMPSGDDGSLEALTCSACSCHRNFHRKELDGADCDYHNVNPRSSIGRKLFVGHHHHHHHKAPYLGDSLGYHISSRPPPPPQMIMSYNMGGSGGPSESDEQEGNMMVRAPQLVKKRFRTKFSQEQKEKMLQFAEKVGWKIQKQEEGVVQQFCQEVGVKRRVLKVWMHNNKHTLAKKQSNSSLQSQDHPLPHQSDPHPHQDQTLGTN